MTDAELCRLADGKKPMPEGLTTFEQEAFQALRHLYCRHSLGHITTEDAGKEKALILRSLDRARADDTVRIRLMERCNKLERDIQHVASAYGRERSLEHADALIAAVYGSWAVGGDNNAPD